MLRLGTRKLLDRSFTGLGGISIILLATALLILLVPIAIRGVGAVFFQGTVEFRRVVLEKFQRGDREELKRESEATTRARQPVYAALTAYKQELEQLPVAQCRKLKPEFEQVREAVRELLGPIPGEEAPLLMRSQYGQTRWDRAQVKIQKVLFCEEYDFSGGGLGRKVLKPRVEKFRGTALEPLFPCIEQNAVDMLRPRWTFYGRFLTDASYDAHFFGGIGPEVLGTLYLTLGAILFAVPMGVIAAVYLVEYARENRMVRLLRICISTLAGVPSIVFGLFGLAFFINAIHLSENKSVLAGSLTLGLLILPTIIRASEEALRAVPVTYKQAALSLGAGQWHAIRTVILPAALPGILTGVIISMGRAAGETAPIIFTAAVSVGKPLTLLQTFTQPTPALPWNIYNLCSEHVAVDEIRHVQYGMVFSLVLLVLLLNLAAIIVRAKISKKLRT
jgi:phosphate transport system permease protein